MNKIITLLIIFFPVLSFAQVLEGTVYGKENEGKAPLPGVNIYWQGTDTGVASDTDGNFEIRKVDDAHVLVFSFVGYEKKAVHVHEIKPLEVTLEPNLELGEVQVVYKDRGTYLSAINPIQTEQIGGAELHKAACCNLA
ncbi:MAG: carboxypeptidase-like regulatory domain-containing protein, partial [Tangfeifania sp.]